MPKRLFIAEKPSVAQEFAKALGITGGKHHNGYLEGDHDIVTWCLGHLIEMCYPEAYDPKLANWSMDTLPFLPARYRYEVIESSRAQYEIVARLLNRTDLSAIYYSGDSAREGEYIQRLVREMAGHFSGAAEYRVWIDSQTREEILRGIREAKPLSAYDKLSDSAYARAIEDYLVGINFSRVLSLKYARLVSGAAGGKYHPIAVGRVMSCVLGMVVLRERQIRDTRVVSYYTVQAELPGELTADLKITDRSRFAHTPENYNNIGLLDKFPMEEFLAELKKEGRLTVSEVKRDRLKKAAPLLFNLAELQAECSRRFKISPAETLACAQSLYEKKLTTYPRTDARVLTMAITRVLDANIRGLASLPDIADTAKRILSEGLSRPERMLMTKYVDDTKVSDHYAIIPTGQTAQLGALSALEKQVYGLIVRRFLSVFLPQAEYDRVSYSLTGCGELFSGTVTTLKVPGWLEVAGYEEKDGSQAACEAAASLSGAIPAEFILRSGKSKPPARYTTGSMMLAMENAGNLIEDEELRGQIRGSGIGTSATRADVITKLERNGYIRTEKKTQTIFPQGLGEMIYDVLALSVPQILNPAYTASWEKGLSGIVNGTVTKDHYLKKIYGYVEHGVTSMKDGDCTNGIRKSIQALSSIYPDLKAGADNGDTITCPCCGKPVIPGKKNYFCTGYKEGCTFSVWKETSAGSGNAVPEKAVMEMASTYRVRADGLWASEPTAGVFPFTARSGKKFKAKLKLVQKEVGKGPSLQFVFEDRI